MARNVLDNTEAHRFEMALDGDALAVLDYRLDGKVMTLTHTGVPPQFEGRGIGARLVQGALDQIRERDLKIVVRCWFVDKFIERNPEYAMLKA